MTIDNEILVRLLRICVVENMRCENMDWRIKCRFEM